MKKTITLSRLDCVGCALLIESAVKNINTVIACHTDEAMQKMAIEVSGEEYDTACRQIKKAARTIQPDIKIATS